jgi:hypothetical protein
MRFRLMVGGLLTSTVVGALLLLSPAPAHANSCIPLHYCTVEVGGGHEAHLECAYNGSYCFCPAFAEIVFNNCDN